MAQRLANVSLLATVSVIGYNIAISKCSTEQSFLTSFLSKWPASLQVKVNYLVIRMTVG
jgi:hypothetical protein